MSFIPLLPPTVYLLPSEMESGRWTSLLERRELKGDLVIFHNLGNNSLPFLYNHRPLTSTDQTLCWESTRFRNLRLGNIYVGKSAVLDCKYFFIKPKLCSGHTLYTHQQLHCVREGHLKHFTSVYTSPCKQICNVFLLTKRKLYFAQ